MRSITFILIFLFLVLPVCAETDQYHIEYASDFDYTKPGTTPNFHSKGINCIYVPDIDTIDGASFMQADLGDFWLGSTENSDYAKCRLYSDTGHTNYIGTGIIGFIKGYDDKYRVQLFIDDELDWGVLSGAQTIWWTLKTGETLGEMSYNYAETTSGAGNQQIHFGYEVTGTTRYLSGGSVHTAKIIYEFTNQIEYSYNSVEQYFEYTIFRNASNPSKLYINNSNLTLRNESAFQTTNWSTYNHDIEFPVWTTWVTTDNDDVIELEINWASLIIPPGDGIIELNQSSYTEPELIQIDAELINYDFTNHIYRILMEYSTDNGANWERLSVAFNSTSVMSSIAECRTATIDSSYYTLPIKIRAVIDDYNKLTSSSSTIATSSEVYYNPPSAYDYTFEGSVFDAGTFAPIDGATVSATGVTDTSATTTPTGTFKLYLSEGVYTITGSMSGYVDNVNEDIVIAGNIVYFNIYLTQTSYTNHTVNGVIKDADTGYALQDVHIIFTNTTDTIDAYSTATGYYSAGGFAQSSTYTVSAVKSGYYTYNGSVTTAASGATYKAFDMVPITATPTPTPTVGPTATYPGGEGHEWSNDEIVTMLRVLVPGIFLMMLIFLLLAVMMGFMPNNGGNQGNSGLGELWRRY